jgi:hypothetical protein
MRVSVRSVGRSDTDETGGGGTIVSLLLSQPPSWLVLSSPWLIYPLVYLLLVPTGLARFFVSTCPPLVFNIITAYVDGITRGTTIAAIPNLLASSTNLAAGGNWLTATLLSGIAVCGGGWIVSGLGLHKSSWELGMPSVLNGGILDTLDLWGGMISGWVYISLLRLYPELDGVSNMLRTIIPSELHALGAATGKTAVTTKETARAIAVLVYGSLLCARVITKAVLETKPTVATKEKKAKAVVAKELEPKTEVVKTPVKERSATPRKSPRPKK